MTKGKYAAKAKNRLANLDNEILQQVVAERDALRRERDELARRIEEGERSTNAIAMRKASDLAGEEIQRLTDELVEAKAFHASELERLCLEVFRLFDKHDPHFADASAGDDFAELFGMGAQIGRMITESGFVVAGVNRSMRRSTTSRARKWEAERKQIRGLSMRGGSLRHGEDRPCE